MAVTGQRLSEIEADVPVTHGPRDAGILPRFTVNLAAQPGNRPDSGHKNGVSVVHSSLMNKSVTFAFEPAAKPATRPPGSASARCGARDIATRRVVPAIWFRSDNEPYWLQIKDVADRLIVAGCADAALLSWHP